MPKLVTESNGSNNKDLIQKTILSMIIPPHMQLHLIQPILNKSPFHFPKKKKFWECDSYIPMPRMTSISTFECPFSRRVGSGEHRCGQGGLIALEAIGLHSGRDHFLGPGCPLQFSEECGEPSRILCLLVRDLAHLSWHRRENSW